MLNINEHLHHYLVKWKISWLFNYVLCLAAQSFMTLCDPMEPRQAPVSTGILQARTLEWVAMTSPPGDLSNPGIEPRSPTLQADSLLSEKPGKPYSTILQYKT